MSEAERVVERLEERAEFWNRHGCHDPEHFGYFSANDAILCSEAAALIRSQQEELRRKSAALAKEKPDFARSMDAPCAVCGEPCDGLAARPSLWPTLVTHNTYAHIGCVEPLIGPARRARDAMAEKKDV